MKVISISREKLTESAYAGTLATVISLGEDGEDTTSNTIIDTIKDFKFKTIVIKGSILANPEVKTLASQLSMVGYKIIFDIEGGDSIEAVRAIKNVAFIIRCEPPEEKENKVNAKNLPLLREGDNLCFDVASLGAFDKVILFLTTKMITRPTVCIKISHNAFTDKIIEFISKNYNKMSYKVKIF